MNRFFALLIFLYTLQVSFAQEEYIESTITRNNTYAFKYFSMLNSQSNENLVISPFTASSAMAMAYIGSEGNTQLSIARTMNFITPYGTLFSFKQLIKRFQTYRSNDVSLIIGNALWTKTGIEIQKKYKNLLKVNFAAHVEDITFKPDDENNLKSINRWVKKASNYNNISIIRAEEIRESDNLILTNFVFLDGNWENPFDEQFTSKDDFFKPDSTKIKVDFMNQTSYLKYNENDIFQILELPYAGRNLSMIVLVPKKSSDIDSLYRSFNSVNFDFWSKELYFKLVNVSIPKFRIENLNEISSLISKDGCEICFSDKADFSRISNAPLSISKIIQKTTFVFEENKNENLTELGQMSDQSFKNKDNSVIQFKADKPFLFVVIDNISGSIIIMGKMQTPGFDNLLTE
jgi:serpin B